MHISKTSFLQYLQCQKLFWTATNAPAQIPFLEKQLEKLRQEEGRQVENYAHGLYQDATQIPRNDPFNEILAQSKVAVSKPIFGKPIFHAIISAGDLIAELDILYPLEDGSFDLFEVKATTEPLPHHLTEIAFQCHVCHQANLKINHAYLLTINNKYVRQGEIEPNKLFRKYDVTKGVNNLAEEIRHQISMARDIMAQDKCPDINIGTHCDCPYECPMKEICWEKLNSYTNNIFTLTRMKADDKWALFNQGIIEIKDIPAKIKLMPRQKIQIQAERTGQIYVSKKALKEFLDGIIYPISFLDFETIAPAVPLIDGTKPYQQLPFQFSLHKLDAPNENPYDFGWIWECNNKTSGSMLFQLKQFLGERGSIVAYNRYEVDKDGDGIYESQNLSLGKIIIEYGTPGIYQAAGRVIDNYGAASSSTSINITVFGEAPIASIQASPNEGIIPLTVQFSGTSSTAIPGHRIVVYEWDFDGNGTYDKISQNGLASWTYREPSTNIVTLRVTDDLGVKGTASTTVKANPNPILPPVVSLNVNPACGDRPLTVILTALATSERTIANYLWDFNGDGQNELRTQANSVTNIYSSVGNYQAQVTAIDDLGLSGFGQTNIQVTEPSNLRVWISDPKDENHIWGTCVSLKGHAVPASRVASFQFQYKLSTTNVWQNLGDVIYPTPRAYSMRWDVTGLIDQSSYDVRGLATDISGGMFYSDPITVIVDSDCRHVVGGIVEETSNGIHSKSQTFSKDEEAVLSIYDGTTVTIPMGSVEANITASVRIIGINTNPINGAASGKYCINQNRQISIEGNPELNMPVTIVMPYPDENNDGIVDGTGILETKLSIYWFDLSDRIWKRCLSQEIHTIENYIECSVYHLAEFGIFGSREISITCDYDGDGKSDPAIYTDVSGLWQILLSSQGYQSFEITCGGIGARPVPGDYDGDGKADIAVYYIANGLWKAKLSGSGYQVIETTHGGAGWNAVPGDYDGDGKNDVAVYQESSGLWKILLSGSSNQSYEVNFGGQGYIPVAYDYDGDGRTDLGVYQASAGYWFGLLSTHDYVPYDGTYLGGSGFIPVTADYDKDGKVDPAVYESASGRWFVQLSGNNYAEDEVQLGGVGFVSLAGDYDGDGKADLVIYHMESGTWFMAFSASNYSVSSMVFGGQGTLPVDAKQ